MTDALRVLIADDHLPTRRGIRDSLEAAGMIVVAEVGDGREAVARALEHRPDVALLDVHMPVMSGVDATLEIRRRLSQTLVVMLTYSHDDEDLFSSLRAGAAGFLTKDIDPARLPSALRGVVAGEAALSRSLMSRVLESFSSYGTGLVDAQETRLSRLTSRELDVMRMLAGGLSTLDVARRLFMSPSTVRVHVSAAVRKLRAANREEALRIVDQERRGLGKRTAD